MTTSQETYCNEKHLLLNFAEQIKQMDPNFFVGFHNHRREFEFDWKSLYPNIPKSVTVIEGNWTQKLKFDTFCKTK